jgi:hypothetical protein
MNADPSHTIHGYAAGSVHRIGAFKNMANLNAASQKMHAY